MDYGLILCLCFGLLARLSFLSGNSPYSVAIGCLCRLIWFTCGCIMGLVLWGRCMGCYYESFCVGGLFSLSVDGSLFFCWSLVVLGSEMCNAIRVINCKSVVGLVRWW